MNQGAGAARNRGMREARGAVRELIEFILGAQDKWPEVEQKVKNLSAWRDKPKGT